jgi:hypothetical protein
VIAREGTFDYVGIVPPHGELPWALELRTATDRRDPSEPSLMGVNAQLMLEEAGLTPNAGFHRGVWRPAVLRVRCILAAKAVPGPRRAAFYMDLAVARALKPGDVLHLSGTGCGGLGLSLLRSPD